MRTRNFTYNAKNADFEKIQAIDCQYHIYGHYTDDDIGGYIRFSSAKTLTAAKKCIGYEVNIIEQDKINDKIQHILQADQLWEKGEKLKRGRKCLQKETQALPEVSDGPDRKENKKIQQQQQLIELLQEMNRSNTFIYSDILNTILGKQLGSLPPTPIKITNYLLHLNTNYKTANFIEDLISLFVFTSDDVAFYEKNGFVKMVVTIFLRIVSTYSIKNRPIHTSDENRHNMYLHTTKDGWIKETPNESPVFDRLMRVFNHKFHQQMVREYQDTPENDLYEKQFTPLKDSSTKLPVIDLNRAPFLDADSNLHLFNYGKKYNEDTVTNKEKNKMEIIKMISKQLHIQ